jgi:predicted transcriptional regulator
MSKPKLRAATIRVEPELWAQIECLAEKDRRSPANFLRLVVEEPSPSSRLAPTAGWRRDE